MLSLICSQCGIKKGEVNDWYIAWADRHGQRFCFTPLDADPTMAREDGTEILCGQGCLYKAIEKHLDSVSFLRRAVAYDRVLLE